MAEPVPFNESTTDLVAEGCLDLPVHIGTVDGQSIVTSKWRLTKPEIEEIQRTGYIWLRVWGESSPPVQVCANYPFERTIIPDPGVGDGG